MKEQKRARVMDAMENGGQATDEYLMRMCDKGIFFGVPVEFVGSFPDRGRLPRGFILRKR